MSKEKEGGLSDLEIMENYFQREALKAQRDLFNESAANCYRYLPAKEFISENDRFVIGSPPILIVHVQKHGDGDLLFVTISSLLTELKCEGSSPTTIPVKAIFFGNPPNRMTPMRKILWQHLRDFKHYSDQENRRKANNKLK